jgi:hypothetical protein
MLFASIFVLLMLSNFLEYFMWVSGTVALIAKKAVTIGRCLLMGVATVVERIHCNFALIPLFIKLSILCWFHCE